ncbi:hypothetical protein O0L34_g14339 [Tuta absoluta]|nr:hypothetical protein O0L34_g14339 [Tuta absoluta]
MHGSRHNGIAAGGGQDGTRQSSRRRRAAHPSPAKRNARSDMDWGIRRKFRTTSDNKLQTREKRVSNVPRIPPPRRDQPIVNKRMWSRVVRPVYPQVPAGRTACRRYF